MRHRGFTVLVKASEDIDHQADAASLPADIDIEDQPDGGANALNVNRLSPLDHEYSRYDISLRSPSKLTSFVSYLQPSDASSFGSLYTTTNRKLAIIWSRYG